MTRPMNSSRSASDRRAAIVDAAIDLIAGQGLRALTHRALDTALGLPPGSVSYYFRTRRALLEGVVDRIAERSRADFAAAELPVREPDAIAAAVAAWVDRLLTERRNHLIVRHALIIDLLGDAELHRRLSGCLFSHEHARGLFEALGADDPAEAAADFIAVLEGLVFDRFAGHRRDMPSGSSASVQQLAGVLVAQLSSR
ncbi:TetR/AcrR family transcriptional regulator [Nocardia sp. NPDC051570]|uniref:TetR/AcrR family transcriptional regulator n=1 Tax=Nocardia sp. NPDC051570 TaxID=3364324 RepID=UPI0037BC39F9